MLCDWCDTYSEFRQQAFNALGNYTPIYVTNRETNETRKFDREFHVEDIGGGRLSQTIVVSSASLSVSEEAAFEEAVEGANTVMIRIGRDNLDGLVPGVGRARSVADDLVSGNGGISSSLRNAIQFYVELRRLVPDVKSVNEDIGLQADGKMAGLGFNFGEGQTIRIKDLVVIVDYEDGSAISSTRNGQLGVYQNWGATDAEGTNIELSDSDASIDPNRFPRDRPVYFGGTVVPDFLINTFNGIVGLDNCSYEAETGRIRVTCRR